MQTKRRKLAAMTIDITTPVALLASMPFLIDGDRSSAAELQLLEPLQEVRKALSEPSPPLDQACSLGVPQICFEILSHAQDHKVLFEAAWVTTNIASGNLSHTNAIIGSRCHIPIVTLLSHSDLDVSEQAAWTVGNIAGESPAIRDILLQMRCTNGGTLFEQLVHMYDTITSFEVSHSVARLSSKGIVVWVLSNLCRGKPQPDLELLRPCFPFLRRAIREAGGHKEVLVDALWAVSYISDGSNDRIQEVLNHGLLGECLERLLFLPAQQNGALVSRAHDYIQETCVLPTEQLAGVFEFLSAATLKRAALGCKDWFYDIVCRDVDLYARARSALTDDKDVETVVLRILGNVVTGDDHQTTAALKLGFLDVVEQLAKKHTSPRIRKELCWSLSNVTAGTNEQILMVLSRPRIVAFVLASLQLRAASDITIVREACWVVSNAFQNMVDADRIVSNGWVQGMVVALNHGRDGKLLQVVMEGLGVLATRVATMEEAAGAADGDVAHAASDDNNSGEATTLERGTNPSDDAPVRRPAVDLVDEGFTILLSVMKNPPLSNVVVEHMMEKYPQAFASSRDYFYMILVPFVEAMNLPQCEFTDLVDAAINRHHLDAVIAERSGDIDEIRSEMQKTRTALDTVVPKEEEKEDDGEEGEEEQEEGEDEESGDDDDDEWEDADEEHEEEQEGGTDASNMVAGEG